MVVLMIGGMKCRRPRPGVGEQIIEDILNVQDFVLHVAKNGAAGAFRGKFFAHHIHHTGDARERIADFVSQPGSKFAESGEMFRAAHIAAMQFFDFGAIVVQLLDHFVELPAELADIVRSRLANSTRAVRSSCRTRVDRAHQFFERPLHEHQQHGEQYET